MITAQQVDAALEVLERFLDESRGQACRRLERLGALAGASDLQRYWATSQAISQVSDRQERILRAAQRAVREIGRGRFGLRQPSPDATWCHPTTFLADHLRHFGWVPGVPGVPSERDAYEADAAACANVKCAHCGAQGLAHLAWVKGEGDAQQYRGFARCRRCGLIVELFAPEASHKPEPEPSVWINPPQPAIVKRSEVNGWSIRREIAAGRLKVQPAAPPPNPPTFDPDVGEWFRPTKTGTPMLVVGEDDASPPQTAYASSCSACVSRHAHSQDYHYARLRSVAARYETITSDRSRTDVTMHAEPASGADDD